VLRPLPYRDAEALVTIQEYQPAERRDQTTVAFANLERYRAASSFSAVTAFAYSERVLSGDIDAERLVGASVDADLLSTLGVTPLVGRGIGNGDVGDNPARVAVLAYRLWTRRFGGDTALVGRSVMLDGDPYTIIGVMPPRFEFPRSPQMDRDVEVWVPRRPPPPMMVRRGIRDLTVVGRLRAGVTALEAQAELAAISARLGAENAQLNGGWSARAVGLRDMIIGRVRPTIIMLSICVAVLLLIACANASAASLARTTVKRQAFGVRLALGADNFQLVEIVVAEALLLAFAAGVIAIPMGTALRTALVQLAPVAVPRQQGIAIDLVSLSFTGLVSLIAAGLAALAPVSWLRRIDVKSFLSDATRTAAGSRSRSRSLAAFVAGQLAFGTALLAITLTLYAGFARINRVRPGFVSERVTTATIPLRGVRYRDAVSRSAVTSQLLTKVRAIPGVEHAAVATLMPMSGGLMSGTYQVVGGAGDSSTTAVLRAVSDDFFETLGIRVEKGRGIARTDDATGVPVVVVNRELVRQAFGDRPALDASISLTPPGADSPQSFRIVGIVANAKEKDLLGPDSPIAYFSDAQASFPHTVLAVRSRGAMPVARVREALRELDPTLALDDVSTLASKVRATYGLQFFLLNVIGAFAAGALILIAVGIYGSVSFAVNADLRAIGVRIALGATPTSILTSLLTRTLQPALVGCVVGLVLSTTAMRWLAIVGFSPNFASSVSGAVAILGVVAIAVSRPAWRARKTDPLTILRQQ
jgi:putative ABC transport system permease protein